MEEVQEAIATRIPDLAEYLQSDREWLWYCGPSLAGEGNKPIREALKEIGFRFTPGGHLMPDGETKGSWGHSCHHPIRKFKQRPRNSEEEPAEQFDPLAAFAAMGM